MIQQIFKAWGIDFPENDLAEIYLTEYLGEKFPSKSFLIDLFPKPIEVEFAYKFDQIEDEDYLEVCKRTYKVLKKKKKEEGNIVYRLYAYKVINRRKKKSQEAESFSSKPRPSKPRRERKSELES